MHSWPRGIDERNFHSSSGSCMVCTFKELLNYFCAKLYLLTNYPDVSSSPNDHSLLFSEREIFVSLNFVLSQFVVIN